MLLRRREVLGWGAGAALLTLLASPRATAGTFRAVTLEELASRSRRCIVGTALGSASRWVERPDGRRIVTTTRVRVDEGLAGDPTGSEVLVETLGGVVGELGQVVHGEAELTLGEAAVLFTAPTPEREGQGDRHRVVAMAQGQYPLLGRPTAGRVSTAARLTRSAGLGELVGRTPGAAVSRLEGLSLGQAIPAIRAAWGARGR